MDITAHVSLIEGGLTTSSVSRQTGAESMSSHLEYHGRLGGGKARRNDCIRSIRHVENSI